MASPPPAPKPSSHLVGDVGMLAVAGGLVVGRADAMGPLQSEQGGSFVAPTLGGWVWLSVCLCGLPAGMVGLLGVFALADFVGSVQSDVQQPRRQNIFLV